MHTYQFNPPGAKDPGGADVSGWRVIFILSPTFWWLVGGPAAAPSEPFPDAESAAAYASYLNGGAVAPGPAPSA
jgi:hypothetical protein